MSIEEFNNLKEKEIQDKFDEICKETEIDPGVTDFLSFKLGWMANEQPTGNQYTGYLKENNKTLEKVQKDEPIFVLRAQDNTAPGIILNWIAKNLDTVDEAKLKEAFQTVLAMRRYSYRRDPT